MSTTGGLGKKHIEWVTKKVEEGHKESKLTFARSLNSENGGPLFPNKKKSLASSLAALTREQVTFMMRRDVAPFQFRIQRTYSSPDDWCALIDGYKTMEEAFHPQRPTFIDPKIIESLRLTLPRIDRYEWVFAQGEQIIKKRVKGEDVSKELFQRSKFFLQTLPDGIEGINLTTWSTFAAESMRKGKPLDCKYRGDATDATCPGCVSDSGYTVLNGEGDFAHPSGGAYYILSTFNEIRRSPELLPIEIYHSFSSANFRASVSGPIVY